MKKTLIGIILIIAIASPGWSATQDFKGTINGNTITAGTGTITMSAGKTLTVTESGSFDEAVNLSSKAPKASPTFTGDILGTTAASKMAVQNPTNTGIYHLGGNSGVFVLDNQTITADGLGLFTVVDGTNGPSAVFHATYNSATITKISDPNSAFEVTDTDTSKICVFKGATSNTVSIKNYRNETIVLIVNSLGVVNSATAPAP